MMGNKRLRPQRIRTKDFNLVQCYIEKWFCQNMIQSALYSEFLNIEHSVWIKVLEPADLFMF